ncbi:MAG: integrase [Mesorhizobium amorphae]|nr:MAG: integrase [Mesorhizobium amorphae]
MREWLTAREIAAERLPDMPSGERGVQLFAQRQRWADQLAHVRQREGRGGGTEYHVELLPALARVTYTQRYMVVAKPSACPAANTPAPTPNVSDRALQERDARLAVVAAFAAFSRGLSLGYATRVQVFVDKFNAGSLAVEPWVRDAVPTISKRSLARWGERKKAGASAELAFDRRTARAGTGVVEIANGGAVRSFVLGLLAKNPHFSADHIQGACQHEFGKSLTIVSKGVQKTVPLPPVRTFQHAIKGLKQRYHVELTKLTNPDLFRSTMALSGTGALSYVTQPNQLWQIDASPVDALCADGRHSVYVCIDIATRRLVLMMSRTPRASAVAMLIRKAIIAWGVPDTISTDNGSDFVARDTQRLFASLDITPDVCTAYSPEQKGHVERSIKTFQHDCCTTLPGYVGHNVADRKAIEGRKSFAARMGETEAATFDVSLTASEMQTKIDEWATLRYAHKPHAGLHGVSPANAALQADHVVRRVDKRALDILVMAVAGGGGLRTVTKRGIRIDHDHYLAPSVLPGTLVLVRQDPLDLGLAYLFEPDGGAFLAEAICPRLSGIDPKAVVAQAKIEQAERINAESRKIRHEVKRQAKGPAMIDRLISVARENAPNVVPLPRRTEEHTTPQIAAALDAVTPSRVHQEPTDAATKAAQQRFIARMEAQEAARLETMTAAIVDARIEELQAAREARVPGAIPLPETARDRYVRALGWQRTLADGTIDPADAVLLDRYLQSAEYRSQARVHEAWGDAWLTG